MKKHSASREMGKCLDLDEEALSLMGNVWTWMKKHSASWEMFGLG
jgi:hypothetical protein